MSKVSRAKLGHYQNRERFKGAINAREEAEEAEAAADLGPAVDAPMALLGGRETRGRFPVRLHV